MLNVVIVILEFDFLLTVVHQMVNVSRGSINSIRLRGRSCDGVQVIMRLVRTKLESTINQTKTTPCWHVGGLCGGCMQILKLHMRQNTL